MFEGKEMQVKVEKNIEQVFYDVDGIEFIEIMIVKV